MRNGDLVAIAGYNGRKVGVVVGYSNTAFKYRVAVLRANSERWTRPQLISYAYLTPAPEDWPATKVARRLLADGEVPR